MNETQKFYRPSRSGYVHLRRIDALVSSVTYLEAADPELERAQPTFTFKRRSVYRRAAKPGRGRESTYEILGVKIQPIPKEEVSFFRNSCPDMD